MVISPPQNPDMNLIENLRDEPTRNAHKSPIKSIQDLEQLQEECLKIGARYTMSSSPGDVSEEHVTYEKRKKGWRMSCDVGEATKGLENEL